MYNNSFNSPINEGIPLSFYFDLKIANDVELVENEVKIETFLFSNGEGEGELDFFHGNIGEYPWDTLEPNNFGVEYF